MRNLFLITFLITLISSCGQTKLENELLDEIGLCFALDLTCGKEHDDKFNQIQNRLDQLEALANMNRELIVLLQDDAETLDNLYQDIQLQVNSLSAQQNINTDDIVSLQNAINDLEQLQEHGIAEVIDPCGDVPNVFDEVVIKLHSGELISYFQQGNKRFLTVMTDGNFITTDSTSCRFSVVNGELID